MKINELGWWIIIFFNQISYVIYRFGVISWGSANKIVESVGGLMLLISFILMFFIYGIKSGLILIPIFWFIITPIGELFTSFIKERLYGERRRRLEEKYGEFNSYQKTDKELLEEVMPGIFSSDKKFRDDMDKLIKPSGKKTYD